MMFGLSYAELVAAPNASTAAVVSAAILGIFIRITSQFLWFLSQYNMRLFFELLQDSSAAECRLKGLQSKLNFSYALTMAFLVLRAMESVRRRAALLPKPRAKLTGFYGAFSLSSKLREFVVLTRPIDDQTREYLEIFRVEIFSNI